MPSRNLRSVLGVLRGLKSIRADLDELSDADLKNFVDLADAAKADLDSLRNAAQRILFKRDSDRAPGIIGVELDGTGVLALRDHNGNVEIYPELLKQVLEKLGVTYIPEKHMAYYLSLSWGAVAEDKEIWDAFAEVLWGPPPKTQSGLKAWRADVGKKIGRRPLSQRIPWRPEHLRRDQ